MKNILYRLFAATVAFLLLSGNVLAACSLERFRLGASYEELQEQLEFAPLFPFAPLGATPVSEQILFVPGEEVCSQEKAFEGAPVLFTFLSNKLVQIEVERLSQTPILAKWAESVYGVKPDKPRSFFASKPNAQWLWEFPRAVIVYSITTNEAGKTEYFQIQSKHHQALFEKWASEMEKQ